MLSIRGVTVRRPRSAAGRPLALEDTSFSAPPNAVTAVLGPPGAGKTTLLAAIAGLIPLARGAVFHGATDITPLSARRRGVALLAPGSQLAETRRLAAALKRLAGSGATSRMDELLAQFGLAPLARAPIGQLSHGHALAGLTLARLARPAPILLIDEAATGLDHEATTALAARLRQEAAQGSIVLAATRSLPLALAADHLVLLAEGRVIAASTPATLYAEPRDPLAAALTGPINILHGHVRELRPEYFVWAATGRYVQKADPDLPRPALGAQVTLGLRPERLAFLHDGETADNVLEAEIADLRSAGPLLNLVLHTPLGPLRMATPSWPHSRYPAVAQRRRVTWGAGAGRILG